MVKSCKGKIESPWTQKHIKILNIEIKCNYGVMMCVKYMTH